jgi:PilZ domain
MEVERRRAPRTPMEVACTLRRRIGSPIEARTRDLGPEGMCICSPRPLAVDELLRFDLALDGEPHVDGTVRVLRQQDLELYAVRFVVLSESKRGRLRALAGSPV